MRHHAMLKEVPYLRDIQLQAVVVWPKHELATVAPTGTAKAAIPLNDCSSAGRAVAESLRPSFEEQRDEVVPLLDALVVPDIFEEPTRVVEADVKSSAS